MQVTSPSIASGIVLAGKYRVDRLLGEGGMGVVLAATNTALRQKVAIKLLRSGSLANAKALGRFEREARAAASLRSEHVARVLDVGKLEDGRPYMVMEYLEGRDLGDVIDHDPTSLSVEEVVDYVLQACEAVVEAHTAGIIHRDLKPKNLFLTTTVDGRPLVKVLDFGISKMEETPEDMSLTKTTEIIGSPSYMSPEQLRASREVDVRTDIWSLGVILYELLTKKLPFYASTVTELVAVILTEPCPDVRAHRPDVPEALAHAISRTLARNREDRFASVVDLVHAIAPFGSVGNVTMIDRVRGVVNASSRPISGASSSGTLPPSPSGPLPPTVGVGIAITTGAPTGSERAPMPEPSGIPPVSGNDKPPTSSARLNIHGGTSVAWGETQIDPVRPQVRRSRLPLVALAAAAIVIVVGGGVGAFYMKQKPAPPQGLATTPAESAPMPSPPGRKDLPPTTSATPTTTSSAVAEAPSTLPSSRVLTDRRPEGPKTVPVRTAGKPSAGVAPAPPPKPDDLSNIGRH